MKREKLGYVVADGGRAKLLLRHGAGMYETLAELECEPAHRPRRDGRTRVFQSFGRERSAVGDLDSERSRLTQAFAARLDEAIAGEVARGGFERFVVAAPPRVLGAIRASLNTDLQKRVVCEHPKDLTKLPELELHRRLDRLGVFSA